MAPKKNTATSERTPFESFGSAVAPGPEKALLQYVPTGKTLLDGTPAADLTEVRPVCLVPEGVVWTTEDFVNFCSLEETNAGKHNVMLTPMTIFTSADGKHALKAPLTFQSGPMFLPFGLTTVNQDGTPKGIFDCSIQVSGRADHRGIAASFKESADNFDNYVQYVVRQTNPTGPSNNKYFTKDPKTMSDAVWEEMGPSKIKAGFWSNPTKVNNKGEPYEASLAARVWPSSINNLVADESGQNPAPADQAFAKFNTDAFSLSLDGISLNSTSITVRWTIKGGIIVERAGAGGNNGFNPALMSTQFSAYVSSAPKVASQSDGYGGISFNQQDTLDTDGDTTMQGFE